VYQFIKKLHIKNHIIQYLYIQINTNFSFSILSEFLANFPPFFLNRELDNPRYLWILLKEDICSDLFHIMGEDIID
jgi:hypothetical protein